MGESCHTPMHMNEWKLPVEIHKRPSEWVLSPRYQACRIWIRHFTCECVISHVNATCHIWMHTNEWKLPVLKHIPQCVAVCCSAMQWVAACCSVMQCVAVCYDSVIPPCDRVISLLSTSRASVAQLVRARDCQSLGRRFDSSKNPTTQIPMNLNFIDPQTRVLNYFWK